MAVLRPIAFLSYSHADDRDGYITELRRSLAETVTSCLGSEFQIFQDRTSIRWGEQWRQRIDESLDSVTFFIPVLSPNFFASTECRYELNKFLDRERRLGRSDLVLAIYYMDHGPLNDGGESCADDLVRIVASRQSADWRELRRERPTSRRVRRRLAELAVQVQDALESGAGVSGPDLDNTGTRHAMLSASRVSVREMERTLLHDLPSLHVPSRLTYAPASRAWDPVVHHDFPEAEPLESDTTPGQVFADAGGRLLVVGKGGSGKSVFLVRLAGHLVREAERDDTAPVPVVFHLSTWRRSETGGFGAWMAEELRRSSALSVSLASPLIRRGAIVPLLDGLDAVGEAIRGACIAAINEFLEERPDRRLAVSCKADVIQNQLPRLNLNRTLVLEDLHDDEVRRTLQAEPEGDALRDWASTDEELRCQLRTPLILGVMLRASRRLDQPSGGTALDRDDIRKRGFIRIYLTTMTQRHMTGARWDARHERWLRWLGRYSRQRGLTVVHLSWMQPDALSSSWGRRLVTTGSALLGTALIIVLAALGAEFLAWVPSGWSNDIPDLPMAVLLVMLTAITGFWQFYDVEIRPPAHARWNPRVAWRQYVLALVAALAAGIVAGVMTYLLRRSAEAVWADGMTFALGAFWAVMLICTTTVVSGDQRTGTSFNRLRQVIWPAVRNGLVNSVLVSAVFGAFVVALGHGPGVGAEVAAETAIGTGPAFVVFNVVRAWGRPVLQHWVLRFLLWAEGSAPLRWERFLDAAVERHLMVKAGTGYMFLHEMLVDYLVMAR